MFRRLLAEETAKAPKDKERKIEALELTKESLDKAAESLSEARTRLASFLYLTKDAERVLAKSWGDELDSAIKLVESLRTHIDEYIFYLKYGYV